MIIAKERIKHNGATYEPNDEIWNIEERDAQRLVDLGVAFFMQESNVNEDSENSIPDFRGLLDSSFKATELKDAAKEIGIEFPGDVTKANLIELIIDMDKVEEIMGVEFEEYEE